MKVTPDFRDAQALAKFANLDVKGTEVAAFRHDYPNFAPASWWDADVPQTDFGKADTSEGLAQLVREPWIIGATVKRWQHTANHLRMAWGEFTVTQMMQLMLLVFDPTVWNHHPASVYAQPGSLHEHEFHRGLLWLSERKWRAKRCQKCQQYIVVGSVRTKYCDRDECGNNEREIAHRAAKLRSYHRNKRLKENTPAKKRAKRPSAKSHKARGN
jgi:hypothetical protein